MSVKEDVDKDLIYKSGPIQVRSYLFSIGGLHGSTRIHKGSRHSKIMRYIK